MPSFLMLNPLEIGVNALKNLLRLALAALFGKPFNGIATTLAIVTTTLAALLVVTSRQDIVGRIRAAAGLRNKVITGDSVPQPGRLTAVGAAVVEILKSTTPIIRSEGRRKQALSGAITLSVDGSLVSVLPFVKTISLINEIAVSFNVLAIVLSVPFWILYSYRPYLCVPFVFIAKITGLVSLSVLIRILPPISTQASVDFVTVRLPIVAIAGVNPVLVLGTKHFTTRFASRLEIIRLTPVVAKIGWQLEIIARRAAPEREGDIQHSNLLQLLPGKAVGTAPRKAVVRQVANPPLAHSYYTMGAA